MAIKEVGDYGEEFVRLEINDPVTINPHRMITNPRQMCNSSKGVVTALYDSTLASAECVEKCGYSQMVERIKAPK